MAGTPLSLHHHSAWNLPHHDNATILIRGDGWCICACASSGSKNRDVHDLRYIIATKHFASGQEIFCDPNPVVSLADASPADSHILDDLCDPVANMTPPLREVKYFQIENGNNVKVPPLVSKIAIHNQWIVRELPRKPKRYCAVLDHWSPFLNHYCHQPNCVRSIRFDDKGKPVCFVQARIDVQPGDVLSMDYGPPKSGDLSRINCACPPCRAGRQS